MKTSITSLKPKKILVRSTNWIGDAIMTTPAVHSIRKNFPDASISILVHPWVADVFNSSPDVDEVLIYDKKGMHSGLSGMWKLSRELSRHSFDIAILLQNAFEAAFITRFAAIPALAGYKSDGRGLLLTHGVRFKKGIKKIHQVHYYQEMVKSLGLTPGPDKLSLELPESKKKWAGEFVSFIKKGPVVGLNPGAAFGPAKRWPPEKFGRLALLLSEKLGATMFVFGTEADKSANAKIHGFAPGNIIDLAGKTSLAEAMALIAICDAFVTNDSGLMHVGAALKTPMAAIFGSTNSITTGPFSENAIVIRKNLDCSPCLKTHCKTDFECMMTITEEEVFEEVNSIIKKGEDR